VDILFLRKLLLQAVAVVISETVLSWWGEGLGKGKGRTSAHAREARSQKLNIVRIDG
jgi:hypothetical protein